MDVTDLSLPHKGEGIGMIGGLVDEPPPTFTPSPGGPMPEPVVWTPSREQVEGSNVRRFMQRHGIADYPELIRRSTQDIEWFWDAVVRDLGIDFFEPYRQMLDDSRGIPWCRWF